MLCRELAEHSLPITLGHLGGFYLTIGSVKDLGIIAAVLGVVSLAIHVTGRARPAVVPA